jgi:beta-fructofuranosidase
MDVADIPYAPIEYVVGQFDVSTLTFTPEQSGILDAGRGSLDHGQNSPNFYASNTLYAPDGRCILLGWVRGFSKNRGWNGCLALPRVLTIGADGHPRQQPVTEIEQLRGQNKQPSDLVVTESRVALEGIAGTTLEIELAIHLGGAQRAGLVLGMAQDLSRGVEIAFDAQTLTVAGCAVPLTVTANAPLKLRLFLDCSILEVFINDGESAITRVVSIEPGDELVGVFAERGTAHFNQIDIWEISSICAYQIELISVLSFLDADPSESRLSCEQRELFAARE